ncbi:MAG: DegQ family serine endoprotease [Thermodesulfovibrionales bacterium]|nr:DegQ family serine endoprotease [Thermodesulfovibrionales bacterium]
MQRKKFLLSAVLFITVGVIVGLIISSHLNIHSTGFSQDVTISKESIDILTKTNQALSEVANAVKPSVVNISSTKTIRTPGFQNPFFNDPFFRRFFGEEFRFFERPREYRQSGLGSGVIVDKDGYILTNYHVIKEADEILVKLSDKREFKGKVIGSDPKTDIAVIKIQAEKLPVIKWGDSDKLKVGEMVLAIGNPFGLNQTVTSGIISATGRANVGIADYEDFIQTDAAINPGNSGGALVNIRGELVGINTAIFSTSGGYMGIGFAIPSNMVKVVMDNLIKKGKVVRGWLGVSIQPITPDLAKQFDIKDGKGVLIGDVIEDSPAEKAGLKRGDVILEIDGKEFSDPSALRNAVAAIPPGKEVNIKILREGKQMNVKVTVSELPADMQKFSSPTEGLLKGVQVNDITPEIRRSLSLPKRISGVIITDIAEGSPADGILAENDIIMEINRKKINNVKDYTNALGTIKKNQPVLILVYRNGSTIYLTIPVR